ncbi:MULTISPECIES: hypothetical protein [unclassified Leucobacter]|uniref:hypothetical protein n=1 Tax=unclassified Leucobacter TaxID=2621730 RepID=UPI0030170C10
MIEQEQLATLQESWPVTESYLERVGQVNNDLMVLRELAARDEYEASLTWLDQLGVGVEDLTEMPSAVMVLWFLHRNEIRVQSAATVPAFREIDAEHVARFEDGTETSPDVLSEGPFDLPRADDQALWALPELQKKLTAWADETATRHGYSQTPVSLAQAAILLNVCRFLDEEPEASPGWAAECLRSALSSEFFVKAAHPQK